MPILYTADEAEAFLETFGKQPPPVPPVRTAVATDDPEKRPCKHCGHTQADHMGPHCRGDRIQVGAGPNVTTSSAGSNVTLTFGNGQKITGGRMVCGCRAYQPKED